MWALKSCRFFVGYLWWKLFPSTCFFFRSSIQFWAHLISILQLVSLSRKKKSLLLRFTFSSERKNHKNKTIVNRWIIYHHTRLFFAYLLSHPWSGKPIIPKARQGSWIWSPHSIIVDVVNSGHVCGHETPFGSCNVTQLMSLTSTTPSQAVFGLRLGD